MRGYPRASGGRQMATAWNVRELRNYVCGKWVTGSRTFDNNCPVDGTLLAGVHEADKAIVDQAVTAARAAFAGAWGTMPMAKRCELLNKVADLIDKRMDEFVRAESL